jgi:hypothetical protein
VKRGLVTIAREKVRTGGMWIDAAKVRITDAGRDALAAGEAFGEGLDTPAIPPPSLVPSPASHSRRCPPRVAQILKLCF